MQTSAPVMYTLRRTQAVVVAVALGILLVSLTVGVVIAYVMGRAQR